MTLLRMRVEARTCWPWLCPPACPRTTAWTEGTAACRLRLHLSGRQSSNMAHLKVNNNNNNNKSNQHHSLDDTPFFAIYSRLFDTRGTCDTRSGPFPAPPRVEAARSRARTPSSPPLLPPACLRPPRPSLPAPLFRRTCARRAQTSLLRQLPLRGAPTWFKTPPRSPPLPPPPLPHVPPGLREFSWPLLRLASFCQRGGKKRILSKTCLQICTENIHTRGRAV